MSKNLEGCECLVGIGIKFDRFWDAARHMVETAISRLPSLILASVVFLLFYILSIFVSRIIRRSTRGHRENLGVVFARLLGAATILLGALVATSIIAPSFQATDLIKVLGIGGVAIGFAFQNILQNFLAGLLLLWAEPFRVGDEIKIDPYEGTVEEIQTRATIIKTYDGRQVVIPNADLFTHAVIVNTAHETRRWEYDVALSNVNNLDELKTPYRQCCSQRSRNLARPSSGGPCRGDGRSSFSRSKNARSMVDKTASPSRDARFLRQRSDGDMGEPHPTKVVGKDWSTSCLTCNFSTPRAPEGGGLGSNLLVVLKLC